MTVRGVYHTGLSYEDSGAVLDLPDLVRLYRSLAGVLRPGGLLRAEWGGAGNVANVEAVLVDPGLPRIGEACNFATAERTAERLAAAGFTDIDVVCVPDPARIQSATAVTNC